MCDSISCGLSHLFDLKLFYHRRMPGFDAMHRRLVESRAGFSASRTSRPVAEPSGLRRGAFGIKM
jgi:hypothetical protein